MLRSLRAILACMECVDFMQPRWPSRISTFNSIFCRSFRFGTRESLGGYRCPSFSVGSTCLYSRLLGHMSPPLPSRACLPRKGNQLVEMVSSEANEEFFPTCLSIAYTDISNGFNTLTFLWFFRTFGDTAQILREPLICCSLQEY